MTPLSDEQKLALADQPEQPLTIVNPDTREEFVVVKKEVFQKMQWAIRCDKGEFDPKDLAPMIRAVMQEDWDAPGMDAYDHYQPPKYPTPKEAS